MGGFEKRCVCIVGQLKGLFCRCKIKILLLVLGRAVSFPNMVFSVAENFPDDQLPFLLLAALESKC